jgi:outer membrane protein assembly factor BamB
MMKKAFSLGTTMFLLLFILVAISVGYAQYPWPMFHHDPTHTGCTSGPGPTRNQTLWIYDTEHDIFGPCPAVVDGLLYISGGFGPSVFALNATTGEQVWNYTRVTWISSSPAVADGRVYFGGFDTNVTALDAATGAFVWNYTTGFMLAASSPAVVDGVVYIGGGYGYGFFALNATTGAKNWSFLTGGEVHSSPAVAGDIVYVGSYDDKVYAFNATTGAKIWEYLTGSDIFSSPAVVDGVVYIGSNDNNLYALNATTGDQIWNFTTGWWVVSSPAVFDGVVYMGSYDGNVYALNATTGAKMWNYTTGGAVSSSAAVAGDVVYIGSGDNNTYALNAQTGTKIWSYRTGGDVWASPAVADGVVYTASRDGKIYAIVGSLQTFDVVWELQTYPVTVLSNSSLSDFEFSQPSKQISFNVTGPKAMSSFCNVTIPKSLLDGPWTVKIDGMDIVPNIDSNDTHTFLHLTYSHTSTHRVIITGLWVVPEFPTAMVTSLFLIATLLATLSGKILWSKKPRGPIVAERKETF